MSGFKRIRSNLVWAMVFALIPCYASAQDTFSITGTFKPSYAYDLSDGDLLHVFANANDHWWKLTLNGVTYSREHYYGPLQNGGYVDQFITLVHADSFTFEFFGPDAALLNERVSSQLGGGSLRGGAFLELMNEEYNETGMDGDSVPYKLWSLALAPRDPNAGYDFQTTTWTENDQFPADEFGYPLVQPTRFTDVLIEIEVWQQGVINGALGTNNAIVDLGSDQEPIPPPPQIVIGDASKLEGDKGTTTLFMTVTLSRASVQTVTVNYRTADGTALVSNKDYVGTSGTLTFQPGETFRTIAVSINGDRRREPNETFTVQLSNAVGATISFGGVGTATILNDD